MVKCRQCRNVFSEIGLALNAQLDTREMLERAARSIVEQFGLKACHFRLISRDQLTLDDAASFGLSKEFLNKGPVDAERSVAEALEGEVVMVTDCVRDQRVQYPEAFEAEGIVSMLTIPLEVRGQVIGVMRLTTSETRDFPEDEIELFKVAAMFCASSIIDSMFHQILGHVTTSIRSSLDLSKVLNAIVTVVCEDIRAKGCTIQLLDKKKSNLEPRAAFGLSPDFVDGLGTVFARRLMGEVLAGECVAIYDGRTDAYIDSQQAIADEGISSILLVPLVSRGDVIGVLSLYTHHPYRFSDAETQLMISIGEQCSLSIDNAMMFAALKRRYENLVDDFQVWFDHTQTRPERGSIA